MSDQEFLISFGIGFPVLIAIVGVIKYICELRWDVRRYKTERDQFLLLAQNRWIVMTAHGCLVWKAPDEDRWRETEQAYKRQQLLDERKMYNLPEITEPKQVDWR